MNNEFKHIDDQVLIAILEGNATDEQKELFEKWLEASEEHRLSFEQTKHLYELSSNLNDFAQIDTQADWEAICRKRAGGGRTISLLRKTMRIAAIFVLALGLGSAWMLYRNVPGFGRMAQTTTTQEQERVVLAEGTSVYLNKNSRLVYPKAFSGKERRVRLEGEGYFEVKRDEAHPFIIESGNAQVEVLGTTFNVKESKDLIHVAVTSGKVKLSGKDKGKFVILTAGEVGTLQDTTLNESVSDDPNILSWKTGTLEFNQTPFNEVLKSVERHFNITINNRTSGLTEQKLSTKFTNPKLEEVFDELKIHFDLEYTTTDDTVIIVN